MNKKEDILYTVRRSTRVRSLRVVVHPGGQVIVTAPRWLGAGVIERFIHTHTEWLHKKISFFKKVKPVGLKPTRRDYLMHKESARKLVVARAEYFNQTYNLSWGRVSIRDQKTRWGSCSKKGNLNFNYKIALIPVHLADYVIVHELCHLKEFNHSRQFWALVAQAIPDYRERRRVLRNVQASQVK